MTAQANGPIERAGNVSRGAPHLRAASRGRVVGFDLNAPADTRHSVFAGMR
jgi:hypothetical protein